MKNTFYSPRWRIARAKVRSNDVKVNVQAFFESKPYDFESEADPQNPKVILHKVKFNKELPESIILSTVEAIEHLRSALDQASFSVASRKESRGNKFPFADDAAGLENEIIVGCKYVPAEIIALFRAYQPYKGGDDLLWALNKLCNVQKHRIIEPNWVYVGGMHIRNLTIADTGPDPFELPNPRWDREKNEIVFARSGTQAKLKYDLRLSLSISFGEVEVVGGQPVLATLRALINKVEGIVNATEAEAKRIGLIT